MQPRREPVRPVRTVRPVRIEATQLGLPLLLRPAEPVDDEALFEFCQINRGLRVERTAQGELVIMSPTGGETGRRNFALVAELAAWVKQDGSGVGFDSSTGFLLPNGAERSPDLAWVRRERWEALTPDQRERFVPLCPDFVVELRSRSDALAQVQEKLEEYRQCGASLGWLIDPTERCVHVYRPRQAAEILADPVEISGDPELPGFRLRLAAIW